MMVDFFYLYLSNMDNNPDYEPNYQGVFGTTQQAIMKFMMQKNPGLTKDSFQTQTLDQQLKLLTEYINNHKNEGARNQGKKILELYTAFLEIDKDKTLEPKEVKNYWHGKFDDVNDVNDPKKAKAIKVLKGEIDKIYSSFNLFKADNSKRLDYKQMSHDGKSLYHMFDSLVATGVNEKKKKYVSLLDFVAAISKFMDMYKSGSMGKYVTRQTDKIATKVAGAGRATSAAVATNAMKAKTAVKTGATAVKTGAGKVAAAGYVSHAYLMPYEALICSLLRYTDASNILGKAKYEKVLKQCEYARKQGGYKKSSAKPACCTSSPSPLTRQDAQPLI